MLPIENLLKVLRQRHRAGLGGATSTELARSAGASPATASWGGHGVLCPRARPKSRSNRTTPRCIRVGTIPPCPPYLWWQAGKSDDGECARKRAKVS
ncbi:MAG: hypothetical protein ACI9ZF_000667 [Bradyrhizobium sp.]|jgi:hypothetical protein